MKNTQWQKFPTLFSLYIAQSIPMSFFSTVVPVIMRQEQYSLTAIGLLQLVKLPWIFKFLWAPMVDNATQNDKKIRRWIIGSELFYAFVIVSIAFLNLQTDFKTIVVLIIIAFTASATQDIATDKFAIKILSSEEKSLGNTMQSAGSFVGSLVGTGVLLLIYNYYGWRILLFLLAGFVIFAIVPLQWYKSPNQTPSDVVKRVKITDAFLLFKGIENLKFLLLLVFYYSGIIGILAMLKPYMVDLGYNVKEIGFISGIFGTSIAVMASLFSGFIIKKIKINIALYLILIVHLITTVYFFWLSQNPPSLIAIYIGTALLWGSYGLATVPIYTMSMNKARKNSEGTDFTIQIVVTQLSSLILAVVSGKLAQSMGYEGLFKMEILLVLITFAILYFNFPILKTKN